MLLKRGKVIAIDEAIHFSELTLIICLCHLQLLSNVTSARWLRVKKNYVELFAEMDHNFDDLRMLDVEHSEIFALQSWCYNSNASSSDHNLWKMGIFLVILFEVNEEATYFLLRIKLVGSNAYCST